MFRSHVDLPFLVSKLQVKKMMFSCSHIYNLYSYKFACKGINMMFSFRCVGKTENNHFLFFFRLALSLNDAVLFLSVTELNTVMSGRDGRRDMRHFGGEKSSFVYISYSASRGFSATINP